MSDCLILGFLGLLGHVYAYGDLVFEASSVIDMDVDDISRTRDESPALGITELRFGVEVVDFCDDCSVFDCLDWTVRLSLMESYSVMRFLSGIFGSDVVRVEAGFLTFSLRDFRRFWDMGLFSWDSDTEVSFVCNFTIWGNVMGMDIMQTGGTAWCTYRWGGYAPIIHYVDEAEERHNFVDVLFSRYILDSLLYVGFGGAGA